MSGIFGFSKNAADNGNAIHRLYVWNREYGSHGSDTRYDSRHGIGAVTEHFSDKFPVGAPVYEKDGIQSVLDTLLYNRDELLASLKLSEDEPISDEELLLRLISEKGYMSLSSVNGDFAGAVYNTNDGSWTLFRDHLGVRPLYYYRDATQFAFSTDIRGLLALPNVDTAIDEGALYYRMMGYNDLTLCGTDYEHIRCIPPGSYVEVTPSDDGFSFKEHTYWKLKQKRIRFAKDEDYFRETRHLVTDAVRRRLDAISGTIGAELSGGLDSGVVDILISRLGRAGKFYSWSWGEEDVPLRDGDDERRIIADICTQENITCQYAPKRRDNTDEKTEPAEILPPFINTLNLSDGAMWLREQGAAVVFTGHGGDEGISHRCSPFELLYNGELFAYLRFFYNSTKGEKLRLLRAVKRAVWQGYGDCRGFLKPYHCVGLLSPMYLTKAFKDSMQKRAVLQPLYFSFAPEKYVMQGGTRVRLDNVAYQGAKNGVRYLIPFADYRVMDYAVSIPRRMFLRYGENRYVYREAFRDMIPESLYKVRYKDTASLRGYPMNEDLRSSFNKAAERIRTHLNRDFWKDYLDFDAIDSITLPEHFTRAEYTDGSRLLHELNRCLLIQRAREEAGGWCERHD